MKAHKQMFITLIATALFTTLPAAQAADLKQLAEQLVNKQTGPKKDNHAIREGGRTVGAGQVQRRNGSHPQSGKSRLIIEKEGANVKKEKGVEDVE